MLWGNNSLRTGADGEANSKVGLLRSKRKSGALSEQVVLLPGLVFEADPKLGIGGTYSSPENRLIEIDAKMAAAGDFTVLHINLSAKDISGQGVVGFALQGTAPEYVSIAACLRSGTDDGFVDCFFDKHILLQPDPSVHVDAMSLQHRVGIPTTAPWRQIVFFLPTEDFRLSIHDLRLFLV